jgi:hypothetical protein
VHPAAVVGNHAGRQRKHAHQLPEITATSEVERSAFGHPGDRSARIAVFLASQEDHIEAQVSNYGVAEQAKSLSRPPF